MDKLSYKIHSDLLFIQQKVIEHVWFSPTLKTFCTQLVVGVDGQLLWRGWFGLVTIKLVGSSTKFYHGKCGYL